MRTTSQLEALLTARRAAILPGTPNALSRDGSLAPVAERLAGSEERQQAVHKAAYDEP